MKKEKRNNEYSLEGREIDYVSEAMRIREQIMALQDGGELSERVNGFSFESSNDKHPIHVQIAEDDITISWD